MNKKLPLYILTVVVLTIFYASCVQAAEFAPSASLSGDVDLILPPALESSDAPFYRGASVKVGNNVLPVKEAPLPEGTLAEYQPEKNLVVISNSATASENDKGQALIDVVTAMQASAIQTAAGQ